MSAPVIAGRRAPEYEDTPAPRHAQAESDRVREYARELAGQAPLRAAEHFAYIAVLLRIPAQRVPPYWSREVR